MSQELLYGVERDAARDEARRERVSQSVPANLAQPGPLAEPYHGLAGHAVGQIATFRRREHGSGLPAHARQRDAQVVGHGDVALLVGLGGAEAALANRVAHGDLPPPEVEVRPVQGAQLPHPHARAQGAQGHELPLGLGGRGQESGHFALVQVVHALGRDLERLEARHPLGDAPLAGVAQALGQHGEAVIHRLAGEALGDQRDLQPLDVRRGDLPHLHAAEEGHEVQAQDHFLVVLLAGLIVGDDVRLKPFLREVREAVPNLGGRGGGARTLYGLTAR